MLKKLSNTVTFGVIGLFIAALSFMYLWEQGWDTYEAWLVAWSVSAFVMCWIANAKGSVPMSVIYGQSFLGGFIGAWFGMFGFWYKVSDKKFWAVLITSAVLQGAVIDVFL